MGPTVTHSHNSQLGSHYYSKTKLMNTVDFKLYIDFNKCRTIEGE